MLRNNTPTRVDYLENDHCCQLFNLADGWLKELGLQSEGIVGHGLGKLMRSRDVIDTAVSQLKQNLFTFLHSRDSGCEECLEAWNSIPE